MTETWRVIDEDGAEHTATVDVRDGDDAAALTVAIGRGARDTYHRATEIRAAIAHRAWAADIAVAEILAPGQQSRAEVEANLRASQEFAGTLMVRHRERDAEVEASAFARGVEASARECEKIAMRCRAEGRLFGSTMVLEEVACENERTAKIIRGLVATKPEPSPAEVLEAIRAGRIKCESCGNVAAGGHIACGRCADCCACKWG